MGRGSADDVLGAGCGAGADETGVLAEAAVSVMGSEGLQPVSARLAAREVRATNAITDKLGDTRAWFTDLF